MVDVDLSLGGDIRGAGALALFAEEVGCRGVWSAETGNDPFFPAMAALMATSRLEAGTGVAIALARSPMTLAQQAHDLHSLSNGRFVLGLGSQIRTHIVRRFSMPWAKPLAQMREVVGSLRAIFAHWYDDEKLDFVGDYYSFTFTAEPFRPRVPPGLRPPPIYLAAVGPGMTALAGEVADGFISHGFLTEAYLREVVMPALRHGQSKHGLGAPAFETVVTAAVALETPGKSFEAARLDARGRIAIYGSTPAYRPVLDHHGLGGLHDELHALSRAGRWSDMAGLVDDETLELFCVTGEPLEVAAELRRRFGDTATRLRLPAGAADVAPYLV